MDNFCRKDLPDQDIELDDNNSAYTVSQVIGDFNRNMYDIYSDGVYIRGEVSSLARNSKWYYTYFDLMDVKSDDTEKSTIKKSESTHVRFSGSTKSTRPIIKCVIREDSTYSGSWGGSRRPAVTNRRAGRSINHTNKLDNVAGAQQRLSSGMIGIFLCKPTLYSGNGSLTFKVVSYTLQSLTGEFLKNLQDRFKLLENKGYFAKEKKSIAKYPKSIAIICGNQSMVFFDIIKNLYKRWPVVEIHIERAYVQGDGALDTLIRGIKNIAEIDSKKSFDFLIIARGGGSLIDILPFFEEQLIEEVFNLDIPVVSAIGHETDRPYLDYVADKRLSTPSMIVSLVPDIEDEIEHIEELRKLIYYSVTNKIDIEFYNLGRLSIVGELDKQITLKFQNERYYLGEIIKYFTDLIVESFEHVKEQTALSKRLLQKLTLDRLIQESKNIYESKRHISSITDYANRHSYRFSIYRAHHGTDIKGRPISPALLKQDGEYILCGKNIKFRVVVTDLTSSSP